MHSRWINVKREQMTTALTMKIKKFFIVTNKIESKSYAILINIVSGTSASRSNLNRTDFFFWYFSVITRKWLRLIYYCLKFFFSENRCAIVTATSTAIVTLIEEAFFLSFKTITSIRRLGSLILINRMRKIWFCQLKMPSVEIDDFEHF